MISNSRVIYADALEGLAQIPTGTVDTCITSPPYYGLRDYGVVGQIGLEPTPEEYINRLVAVFREVRRTLKADGTLWIVIADSYAGSGTTAATAKRLKRKYIGIEINKEYKPLIDRRIAEEGGVL